MQEPQKGDSPRLRSFLASLGTVPILLVVAGLSGLCTAEDSSHFRSGGVDVIAHRGASAYAPENTLSAFGLAVDLGADWYELDCTLTADGEIVVIHDDTVDRTTNGAGLVSELSFETIRALDAGTWKNPKYAGEKIPTLDESLNLAGGRAGIYVEIKDCHDDAELRSALLKQFDGAKGLSLEDRRKMMTLIESSGTGNFVLTRKVIENIRDRGLQEEVVVQSFSPIVCAIAMTEAPEIRTEFLGEDLRDEPEQWDRVLRWLEILDPPGFNPNKRAMMTRLESIERVRDQGKTIVVWTIDGRRDTINFANWGVSAVITNRPDNALRILSAEGHR